MVWTVLIAEMAETAKLCVSNQKGGVGKTATAINTAGALNELGADVLLVDTDPQGNATENLGLADAYDDPDPNLFHILTEPEQRDTITDVVRAHAEMDVLPSNIDMTAAEPKLTMSRRSGEQLDLALQQVEANYDVIIVDCPPNLGNLMDNALFATQNVLIPALAESTSKRAFELLFDHVEALELDYEIAISDIGVAINRIDVRKTQANDMVDWINAAFDDVPVWEIRERAAIQNALEAGESLLAFDEEADMADEYRRISQHIVETMEVDA